MLMTLQEVLSTDEVETLRGVFEHGELRSGVATAAGRAAEVKKNLQLVEDDPAFEPARQLVLKALSRHVVFQAAVQPARTTRPRFSRYDAGMGYGDHLDSPLMGQSGDRIRLDVSVTLFLSDPTDYEGGELVIDTDYGTQAVKLPAGGCVIYPANKFHRVETVTRGTRLVAVLWVQSLVAEPDRRKLLFDLVGAIEFTDRFGRSDQQVDVLRRCYVNLLRMWSQP